MLFHDISNVKTFRSINSKSLKWLGFFFLLFFIRNHNLYPRLYFAITYLVEVANFTHFGSVT